MHNAIKCQSKSGCLNEYLYKKILLTFRRMLKATVDYGTEQFGFQQEVSEPGAVDGHVGSLHLLLAWYNSTLWGYLWFLILLVVQELVVNVVLCHGYFGTQT